MLRGRLTIMKCKYLHFNGNRTQRDQVNIFSFFLYYFMYEKSIKNKLKAYLCKWIFFIVESFVLFCEEYLYSLTFHFY